MRTFLFSILILLFQVINSPAFAFDSFVVKKIQVNGVYKVSKDTVLDEAASYIGQKFTTEDSNKLIKKVFKTGFFSNVVLSQQHGILAINVTERPSIDKLEVKGTKKSSDIEKILAEFDLVEGRIYNSSAMVKAEKKIQAFFMSQKKFNVAVSSKVIELPRQRVNVDLIISESNVPSIKEIKFYGNKIFSDWTLRQEINSTTSTLMSWYTRSNDYLREKLDADLEAIKSFYKDNGFLHIAIESTQVSLSSDKSDVYIAIHLNEGERYYISDTYLDGQFPIEEKKLLEAVSKQLKKGAVFSNKKILAAKENLALTLGDEGYSKADVRIITDVDDKNKLIKVGYYINPGKKIKVRRINITGNGLTRDAVLRREIEQYEGATISTTKIREGRESIVRRGYAKSADVDTVDVPGADDQVDLWIKIVEQKNSEASASIGYTTAGGGLTGQLNFKTRNFLGSGVDIGLSGMINKVTKAASLSFYDPFFTRSGIGFGASLFYQRTNLSKGSDVMNFVTDTSGINFNWSWRLGQYTSYNFGLGYSNTHLKLPTNDGDESKLTRQVVAFKNDYKRDKFREYIITNTFAYNSLDTPILTNKGTLASLELEATTSFSDLKWYRANLSYAHFEPFYKSLIYNLKVQLGYIDTYGSSRNKAFPFFRNYYMGGSSTLRGHVENSVGPQDSKFNPSGANASILIRNQILFSPPFVDIESVRFALFIDAGQVYYTRQKQILVDPTWNAEQRAKYQNKSSINQGGLRFTTGISVTWHTPFGMPIGFAFAKPLPKRAAEKESYEVFTFSLGTELF
jgi:outer membrane protein insertion porin family